MPNSKPPRTPFPTFKRRSFFRIPQICLLCLLALLSVGCATKYPYGINDRFSWNVARPPAWITSPKAPLGPAEKEILSRRGRPDFIRYWWSAGGDLKTSNDFYGQFDQFQELINGVKKSWIYLNPADPDEKNGDEIIFVNGGASYLTRPLPEPIRILCQNGDPTQRSQAVNIEGHQHETWTWIDTGVQIEFTDNHVTGTKKFQGTGAGTILTK